jgi:hypothetical protein
VNSNEALLKVKAAIENAPRNNYVSEMHLQVIKYADLFQSITGKDFCEALGIGPAFGTEFAKMRKIAPRLISAGLNAEKI